MPIDNRYNMPPTGSQGYGFGGPAHQQGAPYVSQPPRNPFGWAERLMVKVDDYVTGKAEQKVDYFTSMNAYLAGRRQHMDSQAGPYSRPSSPHGYPAYPAAQGMPPHAPAMGGPGDPMVQELRQMFGHILTRFADFERSVDQRLSAMEARIDRFVPAMPGARPQAEDAVRHSPPPRIRRKDVATGDRSPASGMRPSAPPPLPPRPDGSSQTQAADPREQRAEWDRRSMDTSVSEHDTDDGRFSDEGPSFSRRRRPPPPPPRQAFPQAAGNTPGLAAGTSDHVRNQYAADFSGELRANVQAETQTKDDGRRHALRLTH